MRVGIYSPSLNLIANARLTDNMKRFFTPGVQAQFVMEPGCVPNFSRRGDLIDERYLLSFTVVANLIRYNAHSTLQFIVQEYRAAENISQSEYHRKNFVRDLENIG